MGSSNLPSEIQIETMNRFGRCVAQAAVNSCWPPKFNMIEKWNRKIAVAANKKSQARNPAWLIEFKIQF